MPDMRIMMAAMALISTLEPAWSAQLADIQACAKVADDKERLACFDRQVAASSSSRTKIAPAPAPAATSPPPKLTEEQKLGLPRAKVEKLEHPAEVPAASKLKGFAAHVTDVKRNATGRGVYTLDNGQVWQQAESNPGFAVRDGDSVQITAGMLGSFFLSVGTHASTRVSRLR